MYPYFAILSGLKSKFQTVKSYLIEFLIWLPLLSTNLLSLYFYFLVATFCWLVLIVYMIYHLVIKYEILSLDHFFL